MNAQLIDLKRSWINNNTILYNQNNNKINQMKINKSYIRKFKFLKTNMNYYKHNINNSYNKILCINNKQIITKHNYLIFKKLYKYYKKKI